MVRKEFDKTKMKTSDKTLCVAGASGLLELELGGGASALVEIGQVGLNGVSDSVGRVGRR